MLYSCTHMATVGVKELILFSVVCLVSSSHRHMLTLDSLGLVEWRLFMAVCIIIIAIVSINGLMLDVVQGVAWFSSNTLVYINVVTLRRTQLVLGLVSFCRQVYHLGM